MTSHPMGRLATLALCALLAGLVAIPADAGAAVPLEMPLQGVLRDNAGQPVVAGAFEVTFTLYSDSEGTEVVWTETWGPADGATCVDAPEACLPVTAGVFRVQLGAVAPLDPAVFATSGGLWLGMQVETDPELPLRPLGTTGFAMHAADAAALSCTGCVSPDALSTEARAAVVADAVAAVQALGYATDAVELPYDAADSGLAAANVKTALDELKVLVDDAAESGGGSELLNEGAGSISRITNQWGLPSYGVATEYVHLLNPTPPKMLLYLYGGQNTGFASSNNLVVSNSYTPNTYTGQVNGSVGDDTVTVANAGAFNVGDHILIHQTIGTNNGAWELNAVTGVQGNSLVLARPLENTYVSQTGGNMERAQIVIAASYNQFEVINGGTVSPGASLSSGTTDDFKGGIVYIRAQAITVKSGGKIQANGAGYRAGSNHNWYQFSHPGQSECSSNSGMQQAANCSGGGGGYSQPQWCDNQNSGAGGGGNQTPGATGQGNGQSGGAGGAAKGDAQGTTLHLGGGGGRSLNGGGHGGGLIVLGAETMVIESGGIIEANGNNGGAGCHGSGGGGAGGTVALFATTVDIQGTVQATGGAGGDSSYSNVDGGAGGEGWIIQNEAIPGVVNQSFATGVQIWVDGEEVTSAVGDPNAKGAPHWDAANSRWGSTGIDPWSTGPLDLTNVADWTLGEHTLEFRETGGAGGDLKSYLYMIQPFTESKPPVNDSCSTPVSLDLSDGPVVLSGTTEDVMGKTKATNSATTESCGGGGPEVVYRIDLEERALLNASVTAPFFARLYLREGDCADGDLVYCAGNDMSTTPLEAGTYFLFVDSDAEVQKGDFTLGVSATPAPVPTNDTCEGAMQLIIGAQGIATDAGTTLYGLDDSQGWCDLTGGGADVFYEFVAGTGEAIDINVQADGFQPVLYLYKDDCGVGDPLTCLVTDHLTIPSQPGGTYFLAIDGAGEKEWGAFDLTVTLD